MSQKYFFIGLFLFVLYWVGYLYRPFLTPIFIAIMLSLATSNFYLYLDKCCKPRAVKTTILTLILAVLFFAPIAYALNSLAAMVNNFDTSMVEKMVGMKADFVLPEYLDFAKPQIEGILESINSQEITTKILDFSTAILKNSAGFVKDMFMILVFYFFVNYYGKELASYIRDILPLDRDSAFFDESANVMSIVFYSILITAIFEGALFAIIAMVYGHDGLLFGILYGFASLVPIIGGALMWIPLALYEYGNGNTVSAIVIGVYSIVVISVIADTFIKPVIIDYVNDFMIKTPTKINSILIFFSILAGLTSFGFWGMIIGPAITTFFISLLKIYQRLLDEDNK
ncbi:MAG: AI-2E family transporter [Epsilonproteobacteria bacterium]|nr:AI-2E family transporter [Campylobacterota bacterium]